MRLSQKHFRRTIRMLGHRMWVIRKYAGVSGYGVIVVLNVSDLSAFRGFVWLCGQGRNYAQDGSNREKTDDIIMKIAYYSSPNY